LTPIVDHDRTGRITLTTRDHVIAATRAILETDPAITLTPCMRQALNDRLTPHPTTRRPRRPRRRPSWPDSRRRRLGSLVARLRRHR
jgi:hypothetical protein